MAHVADGVGCSSCSSGFARRWKYDVFLSFRGEDTRTNFTDHLYFALKRKGLKTFRDEEELDRGQSIKPSLLHAIEESRCAIVVFSPSYAYSTWCLDELQKILQLKEESSLQVFPIFYGVEPSDVRKQKGSFAEAFIKHEQRFAQDKMKVQIWRDALENVATISGWDSKYRHETELIETIAEQMMTKSLHESPCDLGMLIGIEQKLEELESIVERESEGVGFIGIWGTGGVGKTTLARTFYERKCKIFEIHCFLHNIREAYEKDGLISLQRKLLFSLDKRSMEVGDCYEGMKLIKNLLGNRKILLVLDDVSDISQLENLAPKQGWFSKGSIILITTRDKHLLSSHGISSVYDFKFLSDNESLELFLQKAFKREQPSDDYLDLARTIIKYAGGLPLALRVLGSFLCKRTIGEWKDALAKFKKFPPNDILKILQVSFDGLDVKEKIIFLDIVCFFNGMGKDRVIQILETLDKDLHPKIGINVLIEKSLVINYEGHLWVHEILQDMGKYIVYQESPDDAGRRSRILSLEDANHVLERNKGTEAIRGIVLTLEKSCDAFWDPEAFSKMSNLKLLIISSHSHVSHCQLNLPHGLKSLSNELKIIEWEGYPLFYLPSQPQLHDLVELKMRHSKLKELWRGTQSLRSLKSIDLSHSEYLIKTPNFDGIPRLEKLILEGCFNLVEIHQSLGRHKKLLTVDLKDCRKVETLPGKFEMNHLETFVLSGCSRVRKLPEFGKDMERLYKLDLEETAITKLSQSLGNLIGLVELNLKNCKKLACLPYNVCKLKALKIIRISGCSKLSRLPENLNENEALEVLDMRGIAMKRLSLCEYNGEAQSSSSWSCFSFLQRPSSSTNIMLLSSLSFLRELHLSYCNLHDGSLPHDIGELSSLGILNLSGNNFIDLPSGLISNLLKLEFIVLACCPRLRSLPQLPSNLSVIFANASSSMKHYGCSQQLWDFIESFQPQVHNQLKIKPAIVSEFPDLVIQSTRLLTIPGSEVPSWFYNQNYFCEKGFSHPNNVSFIISISPDNCDASEWLGIATCLIIENDFAFGAGYDSVCWTYRFPNDDKFPNACGRYYIYLDTCCSHQLCIMYIRYSFLVVNGLQMVFFGGNAIENKSPTCKIRKCGWRVVCKEDVEAWRRTRDEGFSSTDNYLKIDPDINNISEVEKTGGYNHYPRHHDPFIVEESMTERKIIVKVDGAYSHLNDKVACGGILKDGNNCMREAFLLKLSGGDILTAGLWGCLMGLKRAWDGGFRDIILRSDSTEAVRLIKFEVPDMHKDIALIMEIKGMLGWKWFVDIQVLHRDGNGIEDVLAKRALNGAMGLQILGPETIMDILQATDVTLTEDEKDGGYTQCSRRHDQFVVEEDESMLPRDEVDINSDNFNNPNEVENKRRL